MKRYTRKINLEKLDAGIRRYVKILRDAGVETIQSCQGRDVPGYNPKRDGNHSGDFPYITLNANVADIFLALSAAMREGLPVRSVEQSWFVFPEDRYVLVGPHWRITFWEMDKPNE